MSPGLVVNSSMRDLLVGYFSNVSKVFEKL